MNIIAWLQAGDATRFRFVNHSVANRVFDWLMSKLAGNRLLAPCLLMTGVLFSRIYDGMHYPSGVLTGAILSAGCGGATVWYADSLSRRIGRRWFPLW